MVVTCTTSVGSVEHLKTQQGRVARCRTRLKSCLKRMRNIIPYRIQKPNGATDSPPCRSMQVKGRAEIEPATSEFSELCAI